MTDNSGKTMSMASKYPAVDVLASWWRYPAGWRNLPLVEVPQIPLQEHLGLERWSTIEELTTGPAADFLRQTKPLPDMRQAPVAASGLGQADYGLKLLIIFPSRKPCYWATGLI